MDWFVDNEGRGGDGWQKWSSDSGEFLLSYILGYMYHYVSKIGISRYFSDLQLLPRLSLPLPGNDKVQVCLHFVGCPPLVPYLLLSFKSGGILLYQLGK